MKKNVWKIKKTLKNVFYICAVPFLRDIRQKLQHVRRCGSEVKPRSSLVPGEGPRDDRGREDDLIHVDWSNWRPRGAANCGRFQIRASICAPTDRIGRGGGGAGAGGGVNSINARQIDDDPVSSLREGRRRICSSLLSGFRARPDRNPSHPCTNKCKTFTPTGHLPPPRTSAPIPGNHNRHGYLLRFLCRRTSANQFHTRYSFFQLFRIFLS